MSFYSRRLSGAGSVRGASRRPGLWLVGILVASSCLPGQLAARSSQPYLATVAPLALRFAPPPPERGTEPAPPMAAPLPDTGIIAIDPANQDVDISTTPTIPSAGESVAPASEVTETLSPSEPPGEPSRQRPPVAILPDDLSYRTTAEDFLPYFLPPRLPSTPPSQATYQQR